MSWTSHGHHIAGSIDFPGEIPSWVAKCGGPSRCHICSAEQSQWQASHLTPLPLPDTMGFPVMAEIDMQLKARLLVAQYFNGVVEKTDETQLTIDDVYIVWFCKTLQNWKALVSTNVSDGMYYEVTYNGDQQETYLDAYKKWDNRRYPDEVRGGYPKPGSVDEENDRHGH